MSATAKVILCWLSSVPKGTPLTFDNGMSPGRIEPSDFSQEFDLMVSMQKDRVVLSHDFALDLWNACKTGRYVDIDSLWTHLWIKNARGYARICITGGRYADGKAVLQTQFVRDQWFIQGASERKPVGGPTTTSYPLASTPWVDPPAAPAGTPSDTQPVGSDPQ